MRAGDESETSITRPQYPGDDTRPTSKKELAGWYSYGWAAEVFTVCAMGSFLPITLEQMARDRGVLLSDMVTPCSATLNGPSKTSTQAQWTLSSRYDTSGPSGVSPCVIYIFGVEINTASFAMYTFSISSLGIGIGYIGAVILQIVCILVVIATNQTTFSLRLVLFLIGLWWFLFTIPAALWLRPRPGPPLPTVYRGKHTRSWIGYMAYAWKSLYRTAVRTRHLKDILLFLAAWFLLSDGIATVSGTAVLFAKTQLNMQPAALGLINVIAMMAGVLGAFSWSTVSRAFNLSASQTIIACILLFELVPLYGLLGFIPAIKSLGFLGLQQPWEMFPLGIVYGLVMGGLSSYCRSFFGELIPPGNEAAFYALYAITDKGSSIFGPAIVGIITDRYGEIRPAFVFLAVLIFLPLPLMLLVDVERGKRDALALAAELQPSGAQTYGTLPGHEDHAPPSEL